MTKLRESSTIGRVQSRLTASSASAQANEPSKFEREGAIGGRGDLRLEFGELIGRKPHRAGHRLAMDESGRMRRAEQLFALRLLGFDIESKKIIVFYFELARFGELAIFALEFGDDA